MPLPSTEYSDWKTEEIKRRREEISVLLLGRKRLLNSFQTAENQSRPYDLALECAECAEPILYGQIYDIHEVIITRGDVKNASDEVKAKIHDICNCAPVHRDCHPHVSREKGLVYLVRYQGMDNIRRFLLEMAQYTLHASRYGLRQLAELEERSRAWK
jgi:hypothetical protein